MILGATERLDPLGDAPMLRGSIGARDLPVRDVADERVRERELALALDRRASLAADEPLSLEGMEERGRVRLCAPERAGPEHLPDDRGVEQQALLGVGLDRRGVRR